MSMMEGSLKNHIDMLIFQTRICAGATQISFITEPNLRFGSCTSRLSRFGTGETMSDFEKNEIDEVVEAEVDVTADETEEKDNENEYEDVCFVCQTGE